MLTFVTAYTKCDYYADEMMQYLQQSRDMMMAYMSKLRRDGVALRLHHQAQAQQGWRTALTAPGWVASERLVDEPRL